VLVAGRLVVGNGGAEVLWRAMGAGHGGHWPALERVTALPLSFIWNQYQPSILRSRVIFEDTPSLGKDVKEPLRFYLLESAVLGVIQKLCFFVLKTYLLSVNQKYVF
jgi:hypothetical protein